MAAIPAGIQLVQWAFRAVPATGAPVTPLFPPVEELKRETDIEQLRRLDEPPASPDPKQKPKDKTQPKPEPQPEPQPFDQDKATCQLLPPSDELSKKLKTQVVIAGNCEQAMRDAYNRGYATGRAVSKKWRSRCPLIKADGQFLAKRLKRIILQQENGPRGSATVWSRNP